MNKKYHIIMLVAVGLAYTGFAESTQTNFTLIPLLDIRARYEFGEQENFDHSNASTIRTRAGVQSQNYNGLSGLVEFEATRADNSGTYREGLYAPAGRTVIADPESTELNRLQLQFSHSDNSFTVGRQRIIYDNARFVGNVGWRQNEQTFDAFSYKNTSIEGLTLNYAYIDQVNRIFGSEAPKGTGGDDFGSDSHLFNASLACDKGHKLTGYAYLLDFDHGGGGFNANDLSCDTFGLSYKFKGTIADDYKFNGLAEVAYQQEGRHVPAADAYEAFYYHLNGTVARDGFSTTLGVEVLGAEEGQGVFKTPLATLHKFNGWNDQFLGTPGEGLKDLYFGFGLPIIPKVPTKFVYHYFLSEDGQNDYGHEFDLVAAKKINKNTKVIAKASYYDSMEGNAGAINFDRTRVSLEMNFKY